MTAQDRATESFRRLIDEGRRIVTANGWKDNNYERFPAADDYFRFRTEAMNLVRRTCGSEGISDESVLFRPLFRRGIVT